MFLISKNYKTFRSTITFTLSFILASLSKIQQQTLILITDKMFIDGDSNHVELIKEKMGSSGFGEYVNRIIQGLCTLNPEE